MTKPKPLTPTEVVAQAADLAIIQFDTEVTPAQQAAALAHVKSMASRRFTEDTNLVIGLAIGWATR